MDKKFSKLRVDEMPVVGRFLYDSMVRDLSSFESFSPDFNSDYMDNFLNKLSDVENIVNPKVKIAELKKITSNLYDTIDSLRVIMTKLEGYVLRAGAALNILPKDFGISKVRQKIANKDQEALIGALKVVLQNIDGNSAILESKGWTAEQQEELVAKNASIIADNAEQNLKMDEKESLVEENMHKLNDFWEVMKDVMDTGKRLFKYDNKEKTGDYTLTKIKSRIRHDSKRVENADENIAEE